MRATSAPITAIIRVGGRTDVLPGRDEAGVPPRPFVDFALESQAGRQPCIIVTGARIAVRQNVATVGERTLAEASLVREKSDHVVVNLVMTIERAVLIKVVPRVRRRPSGVERARAVHQDAARDHAVVVVANVVPTGEVHRRVSGGEDDVKRGFDVGRYERRRSVSVARHARTGIGTRGRGRRVSPLDKIIVNVEPTRGGAGRVIKIDVVLGVVLSRNVNELIPAHFDIWNGDDAVELNERGEAIHAAMSISPDVSDDADRVDPRSGTVKVIDHHAFFDVFEIIIEHPETRCLRSVHERPLLGRGIGGRDAVTVAVSHGDVSVVPCANEIARSLDAAVLDDHGIARDDRYGRRGRIGTLPISRVRAARGDYDVRTVGDGGTRRGR